MPWRMSWVNKRPKGLYIVHLSTMCNLYWQVGHLVFLICPKNTNFIKDVKILLRVKFCLIPFSSFWGEVKMSQPIRGQSGHFVFPIGPKNTYCEKVLRSWFLSSFVEFLSAVSESKKSKISQQIRDQGGHLVFPIGQKSTNLLEEVENLLPVKFCWTPISSLRGEVENVAANQRQGRPSCFSDRPKKKLVEDVETLLPIKFRWILFCSLRREVENVRFINTYV